MSVFQEFYLALPFLFAGIFVCGILGCLFGFIAKRYFSKSEGCFLWFAVAFGVNIPMLLNWVSSAGNKWYVEILFVVVSYLALQMTYDAASKNSERLKSND